MRELMTILLDKVTVEEGYPRTDLGDIAGDAQSIGDVGLINPIAVRQAGESYRLIAGLRRMNMIRALGITEIEAFVYSADDDRSDEDIRAAENSARKEISFGDRLMQAERLFKSLGEQRGRPPKSLQKSDIEKCARGDDYSGGRVDDYIARLSGFGSKQTYRRALKVRDSGNPELISRVNSGDMSVRFAADIAEHKPAEQRQLIIEFDKKRQSIGNEALVSAKEARSGKANYLEHLRKEREAKQEQDAKERRARVRAQLKMLGKKIMFPIVYVDFAAAWERGKIEAANFLQRDCLGLHVDDFMHPRASVFFRANSFLLHHVWGLIVEWGLTLDGAVVLYNSKLVGGESIVAENCDACLICVAHRGLDKDLALPCKMDTVTDAPDLRIAGWKQISKATGGEPGLYLYGDEQRKGWVCWPECKGY